MSNPFNNPFYNPFADDDTAPTHINTVGSPIHNPFAAEDTSSTQVNTSDNPFADQYSPPPNYVNPPSYSTRSKEEHPQQAEVPPALPPRRPVAPSAAVSKLLKLFPSADQGYLTTILTKYNQNEASARAYLEGQGMIASDRTKPLPKQPPASPMLQMAPLESDDSTSDDETTSNDYDGKDDDDDEALARSIAKVKLRDPTSAEVEMLSTVFADVDEDMLKSVLQTFDGDFVKSIAYLETKGFESSDAAKNVMTGTKKNDTSQDALQILVERFPTVDADIIEATLDGLNGDMERTSEYIYQKIYAMAYPDIVVSQVLLYVTVFFFFCIGIWAGRGKQSMDTFLTARSSQGWLPLGLNFFAAGLGVWTIFTLPQVGAELGVLGVFDYAFACIVPLLLLMWMGPKIRSKIPGGVTITEFVRYRYGILSEILTGLVTLLYMAVYLCSELTALSDFLITYDIPPLVPVIIVCVATSLYTAFGGMRASLMTDNFQSWIVLILMVVATVALAVNVRIDPDAVAASPITAPTRVGWESLYTLAAAVTAANVFHQGYWQRVYSSRSDRDLRLAALLGSAMTFPVFFAIGIIGTISVWVGLSEPASYTAFFDIISTLPAWINGVVMVLTVAFVSSSVDTLQSGLTATIVNDIGRKKIPLWLGRLLALLINVPCLVVSTLNLSVLQLFLIADLVAAAIVMPLILGLFSKFDYVFAGMDYILGFIGGMLGVIGFGWIEGGSLDYGVNLLTLPNGLDKPGESLGAFLVAPVVSVLVMALSAFARFIVRRITGHRIVDWTLAIPPAITTTDTKGAEDETQKLHA
ncbi:hypothetical protein SmJEL517_g02485 [Synchytrium microbalum]|uniref:CUE domain-containing protein n=1 Tax=Synchytrium microbalum TaxID=1806994 RepID=A0A507C1R8_9FUNG|nr:uncharacterized protein SmJEL517_g02485 [Synchytrium microbalum]TPX35067.1 hypothetical protein SmJEL517_g02485 [Synchytrium microbalum]